jgi:hypothetical protein
LNNLSYSQTFWQFTINWLASLPIKPTKAVLLLSILGNHLSCQPVSQRLQNQKLRYSHTSGNQRIGWLIDQTDQPKKKPFFDSNILASDYMAI